MFARDEKKTSTGPRNHGNIGFTFGSPQIHFKVEFYGFPHENLSNHNRD